jgi:Putative peptidoglycan binding domain
VPHHRVVGQRHAERSRPDRGQPAGRPAAATPTPTPLHLLMGAGNAAVSRLLSVQRQSADTITAPPERIPGPNDPLSGTTSGDLSPAAPRPLVRLGSHGDTVAELQVRLNEDGARPRLDPDGSFGGATDRAVRAFQRRHGLLVDGIVGPQTWGLLDELSRADILGPHDVLAGTHAVSDAEAGAVAAHMATTPPAPGHLTGGGNGGPYEREVFAALDAYYAFALSQVVAAPTSTISDAQTIARVGQRLIDDFYSDHIVMASRPPGLNEYHPGSFQMQVADAATRHVDPEFARLWVEQDIEFTRSSRHTPGPQPGEISAAHQVDTRRPADAAEVRRVADKYLQSGRQATVIRYIQTYPAEASEAHSPGGHVFLGLGDPAFQGRRGRWDLLSGMMHEYLHLAAHPHFSETAERMGGTARRVLIEGMCDYFRVQAWNALAPRFASDAGLRSDVEGSFFTANPDQASIVPHDTYDEIADARAIVSALDRPPPGSGPIPLGSAGGEANARAAYFMGHVDLLGIGPGTRGDAPAGNLGTRGATDDVDADIYVVPPGGETLARVFERTNSTRVFTSDGLGLADPAQRLAGGTRLRVDGIRYVRAVLHDTRAQVANQNGVELAQLEVANRWAPAPGDTAVPVGTRVLIPSH